MSASDCKLPILSICSAWAAAWNSHDVGMLSELVQPDVEFVTVAGVWLRGASEFRAHHADMHLQQMRESTWTNIANHFREVQNDLILVHLQWAVAGDCDPDGSPRAPRRGIFSWLLAGTNRERRILAGHNTNLRYGFSHRSNQDGSRGSINGDRSCCGP